MTTLKEAYFSLTHEQKKMYSDLLESAGVEGAIAYIECCRNPKMNAQERTIEISRMKGAVQAKETTKLIEEAIAYLSAKGKRFTATQVANEAGVSYSAIWDRQHLCERIRAFNRTIPTDSEIAVRAALQRLDEDRDQYVSLKAVAIEAGVNVSSIRKNEDLLAYVREWLKEHNKHANQGCKNGATSNTRKKLLDAIAEGGFTTITDLCRKSGVSTSAAYLHPDILDKAREVLKSAG